MIEIVAELNAKPLLVRITNAGAVPVRVRYLGLVDTLLPGEYYDIRPSQKMVNAAIAKAKGTT